MSPARISDVACRRVQDGDVVVIERRAGELRTDDATTFPSDQLLDLCVERETVAIRELPQRITGLDRDLDGSRFAHTIKYTGAGTSAARSTLIVTMGLQAFWNFSVFIKDHSGGRQLRQLRQGGLGRRSCTYSLTAPCRVAAR
jgi:hypothetical protein